MHGVHQGVNPCNGNVIPLFMQSMSQLDQISGGIWAPPNPTIQFVPQVFNRGLIWTEYWSTERVYVVVSQKLLANSSDMGPGIVMLEDPVARLHTWDGNWAEDFVSIHERRLNYRQPLRDTAPNQNRVVIAFPATFVHMCTGAQ